jgi:hypothetical protein
MNDNYGRLKQQFSVKFPRSYLREYFKGCSNTIDVSTTLLLIKTNFLKDIFGISIEM